MLPTALKIYLAIEPVDMANSLTDLYQRPLNAGLFGSLSVTSIIDGTVFKLIDGGRCREA